jgi:hypothetical protein
MNKGTTLGKRDTTLTHRHTFSEHYSSDRLPYNLLLKLDEYYSKPIKGLDEATVKKMHNVFMIRWTVFHAPIHSAVFAMDKHFCRREMDEGIKKNIWSVMEDFSKTPGGKDFRKMKALHAMFVDGFTRKGGISSIRN